MKRLLLFLIIGASCASCKKNSVIQHIDVTITDASSYTTYAYQITNGSSNLSQGENLKGNTSFTITAKSGDVLNINYRFSSTAGSKGTGKIDMICNGKTIFHADGGFTYGINVNVP